MNARLGWWRTALLLAAMGTALAAWAQQAVYVEYKGQARLVRKVHDGHPYVVAGDRLVSATGDRIGLVAAQEYLPLFVTVSNMRTVASFVDMTFSGGSRGVMNHTFEFRADFVSAFPLENVFLVLELGVHAGPKIFLHEIGDLEPRVARHVAVYVPLTEQIPEGDYKLHLFADGGELMHSEQPAAQRNLALDRMVRRRIEGVSDSPLQPLAGPAPEYPQVYFKQGVRGVAVVKFRVGPNGEVIAPELKSATAPEFGASALAAVQQWRFLPRVKEGGAVESMVEMPFQFEPPEAERK